MRYGFVCAALCFVPMLAWAADRPAPMQWAVDLHAPIYNMPQALGRTVYLDSAQAHGPNVFAVAHGKVLWRFATQGLIQMPVALGGGQVFVASDIGSTHFMRALDAKTGRLIWNYARHQPPQCMCSHVSHYTRRLLFAQTDGHSLYAFRPASGIPGRRIWRFAGDGAKLTAPVLWGQTVLFGSADHSVYCVAGATGKTLWRHKTGYAFVAPPAVWENTVIIGNRGGTVHAYAAKTGTPSWNFSTNGPIDTRALLWRDRVFVASGPGDRGVYALSARTGRRIWYVQMPDYAPYEPVLFRATLIVASRDGSLLALSADTGKVIWRAALHGEPMSQAVVRNATVVLKVNDHEIKAFAAADGRLRWIYRSRAVVTAPSPGVRDVYVGTSAGMLRAFAY